VATSQLSPAIVDAVVVLRRGEFVPRVPERRDLHHLSRAVVHGIVRPAMNSGWPAFEVGSRSSRRKLQRQASLGFPGPKFVTRDAAVDLALLGKGFHIVVGPCRPIPTGQCCNNGTPSTNT